MSSYLKLNSDFDTYVSFENSGFPTINTNNATFAVWCRFSSTSSTKVIFSKYDGSNGYQAYVQEQDNGDLSLVFMVETAGGKTTSTIDNIPVKLDEWQLFCFMRDKDTNGQYIYIDGVIHADTANASLSPVGDADTNVSKFYIGEDIENPSSSIVPDGDIDVDSLSIYTVLLSQDNITALYNGGQGVKINGTEYGIIFGLNLDEGTGSQVTDIIATQTGTILSSSSPFDNVWGTSGGVDAMRPSYIKLYLTSLEPDLEQKNYSQSIGGYMSDSLLYPETTLSASMGLYQTSITLVDIGDWSDWLNVTDIAIRTEVASVASVTGSSVTITDRGVNGNIGYYRTGTVVQGITSPFNDSFSADRKQYRCYAVYNTSTSETAYGVSAYFKQVSINPNTTMRLAFEYPKSQGISGVSTSWTSSMLIDSSLAGTYVDNLFTDSYFTFVSAPNAGERRRISSYDGDTGTFVFADSLPVDYDSSIHTKLINYSVDASPAQRIKSGVDAPIDTDYISDFSEASDRLSSVELAALDLVGNLGPQEIIYVWVEREIGKSSISYDDNSYVLSIDFNKELEGI